MVTTRLSQNWRFPATVPLFCRGDEVHVWRIDLSLPPAYLQRLQLLLSHDERMRAGKFRFQRDRDRFTATRGCLRLLLGHYLGVKPETVQFCYGPQGKPALQLPSATALSFNVSHTHEWALVAIGQGQPVGIDLEHIQPDYPWQAVSDLALSPKERAMLAALPPEAQSAVFFKLWTGKEAYVKATGEGLLRPFNQLEAWEFDRLEVGEDLAATAVRLPDSAGSSGNQSWCLYLLHPLPNYVATLAVLGPAITLSCWDWHAELFSLGVID
ncbi:4'-phosphopantetheinyl transferase superfamily protein [Nodosilinea sp. FACHB-131]|uniref:4'-phosphopantetheinyl transferase family protein n=1 Tax=Cyanophyceae TaxID=3028117 RepID=UPI0016882A74|nr:4'-phosphopantetheinyl transferase superfamily protein [Nodosilinea sp. FACHB-131]MBD1874742.1 4'-phosphopantetheinyl transferase superfamily protein [Nodosilinea sp. FACHB-131]